MKKVFQFIFFVIAIIALAVVLFGELDSFLPLRISITFGFLGFILEIKTKGEAIVIASLLLLCAWCYIYTCHIKEVRQILENGKVLTENNKHENN